MNYLPVLIGIGFLILLLSINFYKEKFFIGNPTSNQLKEYLTTNLVNKDINYDICSIYATSTAAEGEKIRYLKTISPKEKLPENYIYIDINIVNRQLECNSDLANILQIDNLIFYFKTTDLENEIESPMQLSFEPTSSTPPPLNEGIYNILSIENTLCDDPTNCADYNNSKISDYLSVAGYTKNIVFDSLESIKDLKIEFNKNFEIYKKYNQMLDENLIKVNNINLNLLEEIVSKIDTNSEDLYNSIDQINTYLSDGIENINKIPGLVTKYKMYIIYF